MRPFIQTKVHGRWSVKGRGYVPYVCGYQLEKDYRLVKGRVHACLDADLR